MLKGKIKSAAGFTLLIFIVFFAALIPGFSDTAKRTIEVADVPGKVMYNGTQLSNTKMFVYNSEIYMPLSFLRDLFNKEIEKDSTGSITIKDKPDAAVTALKADAAVTALKADADSKALKIKELEDKVKELNGQLSQRLVSLDELEAKLNKECGEFEDLDYTVLLSGNQEEVRVKFLVDLEYCQQAWNGLNSAKRLELLQNISGIISGEYSGVKIKGFIKDTSKTRKLLAFYNNSDGSIKSGSYKNYSKISELEEKFNDDYGKLLNGVDLTYKLSGNENNIYLVACIQTAKYGDKWSKLSDNNVKSAMKKLYNDLLTEFKDAAINETVYDLDNRANLAEFSKQPNESPVFSRN